MKPLCFFLLAASLVLSSQNPPQESPELQEATALTESVAKLFNDGKYDEALKEAKRALQLREKLLPRTDPRISTSLGYLGDLYWVKADYKAAKDVFRRLLQINEERFGPENPTVAATLDRLGEIHLRERSLGDAEAVYQRSLAVREKSYGASSPQVARSLYQLGEVYRAKRDFDRGAANYRRALMIFGPLAGVESREFERTSDRFTCLAWENKRPETIKEVEAIRRQFLSPDKVFEPYEILNGRALSLPKPELPPLKIERGFSLSVHIKVEIDETGKVIGVGDMCEAPSLFSGVSVAAAWKARFTPTKLQGQPIKVKGVIQYRFVREW